MKIEKYAAASATHIGRVREENQDCILFCPEYDFFAVSDGMGGVLYGKKSAMMACESMKEVAAKVWTRYQRDKDIRHAASSLKEGLERISDYISEEGNTESYIRFGATFCGAMILDEHTIWINIGDSRGYLLTGYGRSLRQVTVDHNMAQLVVSKGRMTREEADKTDLGYQLLNFVGMDAPAEADVFITANRRKTQIILCSDGLYGMTGDREMARIVSSTRDMERACRRLICAANARGGKDNISVVLIRT